MARCPDDKPQPTPPKMDDPEQSARFIEAARKLGIEEAGEVFERAVERILSAPKPSEPASEGTAQPEGTKRKRGRPKIPR